MKTIKITKMQGCGNDFVVLDYSEFEKSGLTMSELAKKLGISRATLYNRLRVQGKSEIT